MGKIAAIRIPSPRARAQTPSQRQYRISIPPVSWSTVIIYGTGGRVTSPKFLNGILKRIFKMKE